MYKALGIVLFSVLFLYGCVYSSFERNNIPDRIGGDSTTMLLNYENRVRNYDYSVLDSHIRIYIEIEEPYVISVPPLKDIDKIYSIAPIEGDVVYRVELSDKGKILSSKKVLSGGLGLDQIADEIFRQVKVEPSFLAGKAGGSAAYINIKFRADRIQ